MTHRKACKLAEDVSRKIGATVTVESGFDLGSNCMVSRFLYAHMPGITDYLTIKHISDDGKDIDLPKLEGELTKIFEEAKERAKRI